MFDDDIKNDDVEFPYGDELINVKVVEISNTYLDALDEYIGAEIVIPGRDALHFLGKVKNHKQDASGNTIGKNNSNPILGTRIYELEFIDVHI